MEDDFLAYYNNELAFLRQMGAQFANSYPKIAGRLRLSDLGSEDPNVARLTEAFAFLTARIHRKLDDDLPELADALLDVLYPHYQLPIPALSIIQFRLNPEATASSCVSKGAEVETSPAYEKSCRFVTCYDVDLYPIKVNQVSFSEKIPALPKDQQQLQHLKSVLRINISGLNHDIVFSKLSVSKIRFFINLNSPYSYKLYQLLFKNTVGVGLTRSLNDPYPLVMENTSLRPVGFDEEEGLFPYPEQSFLAYRLLTEFFAFPHKFLFFDLHLPEDFFTRGFENNLEILIYLNATDSELVSVLTDNSLLLGCTPLTNLFEIQAEPVLVDHSSTEYLIVPDARRFADMEVYQIREVLLQAPSSPLKVCSPLYGVKPELDFSSSVFWHTNKGSQKKISNDPSEKRDVFISFCDLEFNPVKDTHYLGQLTLWCTNHSLPHALPYGGGEPKLQLVKGEFSGSIHCLRPFTQTYRLPMGKGIRWQLISHLMLNSLPLGNRSTSQSILQEILRLYNFNKSEETNLLIESLESLHVKPAVARCQDHYGNAVYRGTEIVATFKEGYFSNLFLFSSVLEKFLGTYCSLNSFNQLAVKYSNHSEELMRWQPRAGSKVLL